MAKKKNNKPAFSTTEKVVGIGALLLIGKYVFFPSMTRADAIKTIIAAGHTSQNYTSEKDWGTNYLTAWATAIRKSTPNFKLNNTVYNTSNGKNILSIT